jgi:protein phosphatase
MAASDTPSSRDDPSLLATVELPVARPPRVRIQFGALTHVGKVRSNNEDQFLVARMFKAMQVLHSSQPGEQDAQHTGQDSYAMLVADGLGGAGGGEVASALAIERAKKYLLEKARWFHRVGDPDSDERVRIIQQALGELDRDLIEQAKSDPDLAGMGTTLTAARITGDEVFLVHVGDSRAYLFRQGELDQLTHDHTLTQQLVDAGLVDPGQARRHRLRNVLTNVVGGASGVRAELGHLCVCDGDRLLLCTDGLNGAVEDGRIAELLARHPDPQAACQALIQAALDGGGRDNVTVVLAAFAVEPA